LEHSFEDNAPTTARKLINDLQLSTALLLWIHHDVYGYTTMSTSH